MHTAHTKAYNITKKIIYFSFFLLFLLFQPTIIFAQKINLSGVVINKNTKEPLPFVAVSINSGKLGAITDLDGNFSINTESSTLQKIEFSTMGYYTFTYTIKQVEDLKILQKKITISLLENIVELEGALVISGENPAHRIIKAAVKNRNNNHPQNLKAYQYQAYHKSIFTPELDNKTPSINLDTLSKIDTTNTKLNDFFANKHLFISENISTRQFLAPDFYNEIVVANRISGLKKAPFALGATSTQPFSFYQDFVKVLRKEYLSPLAIGSINKYDFSLEQSIPQEQISDTVFVISFVPRKDKNIIGLAGVMYIHSKGYGLQSILINSVPEDENFISFKFQQYSTLQQKGDIQIWFPTQLAGEYLFKGATNTDTTKQKKKQRRNMYISKTYIQDIALNPPLRRKDFSDELQQISENAHKAKDSLWRTMRLEKLSSKDTTTYKTLDSLGKKANLDKMVNFVEKVSLNRIGIGKNFDISLNKILKFNRYEAVRIGIGIETSDELMKKCAIFGKPIFASAYVGYGIRDNAFKYGGTIKIDFKNHSDWQLGASIMSDLEEPAQTRLLTPDALLERGAARALLAERMDRIRKLEVFTTIRPIRNHQLYLFVARTQYQPQYDYIFAATRNDLANIGNNALYEFAEIGVKWNYAKGQVYTRRLEQRLLLEYGTPVFNVNFVRGVSTYGGNYDYTRLEGQIEYKYKFRYIGTTQIILKGGLLWGDVPYMRLMHAPATTLRFPGWIKGYLQTADLYQFLTDRYAGVFLSHYIGRIFKSNNKKVQPEFSLHHNMFWGEFEKPFQHFNIGIQTPKDIFLEGGILIDKIYRTSYVDIAYINFGIGIFSKYGYYADKELRNNFALKTTFSIEF